MKLIKSFIVLAALALMLVAVNVHAKPANSRPTKQAVEVKSKPAKTVVINKAKAFPNIFGFIGAILKGLNIKNEYRDVEKNYLFAAPEKLPKLWKTPKGAKVHSKTKPTALELSIIDEKISRQIAEFEKPFDNFQPADFGKKAKKFKRHSDYRYYLVEDEGTGRVVPAESESIKGCPIIKTSWSSTGFASGVTAGFKTFWGGAVKPTYPFVALAKLSAADLQNPACVAHFGETLQNENDHLLSSNDGNIYNHFRVNDVHPFDW